MPTGRVSWFQLDKKFGFISLDDGSGDAFLHVSALKAAGYVSVPAGTTMEVRVEQAQGRRRVIEVLAVDTTTAHPSEPKPVLRRQAKAAPNGTCSPRVAQISTRGRHDGQRQAARVGHPTADNKPIV